MPGHVAVLRVVMADMRKGAGKGGCNITVMIKNGPPSHSPAPGGLLVADQARRHGQFPQGQQKVPSALCCRIPVSLQ
jgi:hypothetical protein